MRITVEVLAQLRDAARGQAVHTVECAPPATVEDVVRSLAEELGEPFAGLALDGGGAVAPGLLVALGGKQVRSAATHAVADGDALVLATPIAGG